MSRSPLLRLWGEARGVHGRLFGAAVLGALAAGCAVGLMATSAWLIARAAQQPPVLYLMVAVVAVRTFGIGRGVLRYLERLVSHDAAFRVLARIREKLVAHLALIAPAGLPLWRKGDLLARTVDDVDDAGDAFIRGLLPLAAALLVGGGTVVLASLILPAAGLALAVALLLACVLAPLITARRNARIERDVVDLRARRTRLVTETLDELAELTVLGAMDGRLAELDLLESANRRVAAGTARAAGIAAGLAVASMGAAVWLAAKFGVPAVVDADLDPVLLAVIVLTPLALTDTVQAVGLAASTLRRSSAAVGRLFEVLDAPSVTRPAPERPEPLPRASGRAAHPASRRRRPLARRRPGRAVRHRSRPATRSADRRPRRIRVRKINPARGAAGLPHPDGRDHHRRRDRCGPDWIPTSCAPCSAGATNGPTCSIRAWPRTFGWPGRAPTIEQVTTALAAAGAGDWLAGLPGGLDTRVGEHGQAVSGGERQRIALARAVLADRPVLLADEPAAHLDPAVADAVTNLILRPTTDRCVRAGHPPPRRCPAGRRGRAAGARAGGARSRSGSGRGIADLLSAGWSVRGPPAAMRRTPRPANAVACSGRPVAR